MINTPFFLTFTIGRSRQYILKSIGDFIRDIKNENTIAYGKNLEFKHKLSLFDGRSARLIALIADEYEYGGISAARTNRNYFYYSNALANKALFLSKRGLDVFFDLYQDQEIRMEAADMAQSVSLIAANPDIRFKIDFSKENQCLALSTSMAQLIGLGGEKHQYILHRGILHRTTEGYYKTLGPMIGAFSGAAKNAVLISKEDATRFMTFLYPRLKEHNLLDGDADIYDIDADYCPLVKKLYFDVSKGDVLCKVLFCYGEQAINPLKDESPKKSRNILAEYKLVRGRNQDC